MLRNNTILWNSHRLFSQITYSLRNTACSLIYCPLWSRMWEFLQFLHQKLKKIFLCNIKICPFWSLLKHKPKELLCWFHITNLAGPFSSPKPDKTPSPRRHETISPASPVMTLSHPSYSHTLSKNLVLHSWNAPESPSWSFSEPGQGTGAAENKPIFPLAVFRWQVHCAALEMPGEGEKNKNKK